MKQTNFKTILCTSLMLAVITGCGKDGKSNSPAAPAAVVNPINANITNPTGHLQGQQALTNATNWYNSLAEPSTAVGSRAETRQVLTYPNSCSSKTYLKFFEFTSCSSSSPSTSILNRTVNVEANPVKSGNAKLAPAFQPANMMLLNVTQDPSAYGGVMFRLTYGKPNYHVVVYTIDTSFHSSFNPTQIEDSESRKVEVIANPNFLK